MTLKEEPHESVPDDEIEFTGLEEVDVNTDTDINTATREVKEEMETEVDLEAPAPPRNASPNNNNTNAATSSSPATPVRFPFPKAFYDPNTNRIMMNPVVASNGESYEKSDDLEEGVEYYPNRALKVYIEEELDRFTTADGSLRGTLLQWGQSLRSGWQQLIEKAALPAGEHKPLPDAFYCPISFDLIHEPVIDPDGMTYEKSAIYFWLQNNDDNPITRNPLRVDQLRDNLALLRVLEHLAETETEHPSVQKWKTDHATHVPFSPQDLPPPDPSGSGNGQTNTRSQYATHQEELEAIRRRRKILSDRLWTAWSFAFLIVVFFFPSYVLLFILLTVGIYVIEKVYCVRRDIQDRRELMLAHQREVEAAQAALRGEHANSSNATASPASST